MKKRGKFRHRLAAAAVGLFVVSTASAQTSSSTRSDSDGLFAALARHRAMLRASPFRSLKWKFLGPADLAGRANDIAVVKDAIGPHVYVAYHSGGLWRSDSTGLNTQPIFTDAADMSAHSLAIAPSAPNEIWLGSDAALYHSSDGGRSWRVSGLAGTRTIWRVVVDPHDPATVYVAAQGPAFQDSKLGGVYKTRDGGKTWRRVLRAGPRVGATDIAVDPSDPTTVYATTYQKLFTLGNKLVPHQVPDSNRTTIWKSRDRGETWTEIAVGLPAARYRGRIGIDVSRASPNVVYAIMDSYEQSRPVRPGELTPVHTPVAAVTSDYVVYRSDNGGRAWQRVTGPGVIQTWGTVMGPNDSFGQIRVDPADANTVYALGVRLYVSRDGGKNWAALGGAHWDNRRLWIDPADGRLYLCTDGGAYWSADGGRTWTHQVAPTTEIHTLAVDDDRPFHVYASIQDYSSFRRAVEGSDNPNSLEPAPFEGTRGGEQSPHVTAPDNPQLLIANRANLLTDLYRFDLRDTTNESRVRIDPQSLPDLPPFRSSLEVPLIVSRHDSKRLYIGYQFVLRSPDFGDHWQRISPDLTDNDPSIPYEPRHAFQVISALDESPLDADLLYAGTDDGHLWMTRDGGLHWSDLTSRLPARKEIASIAVSAHDTGTVYLTQASRNVPEWRQTDIIPSIVLKSVDHGATFQNIAAGLPAASAYVIREDPDVPGLLYLGTNRGVYVSSNGGGKWDVLGGNLPNSPVRDIAIQPRERLIVIGTWGRGVWAIDQRAVRATARR